MSDFDCPTFDLDRLNDSEDDTGKPAPVADPNTIPLPAFCAEMDKLNKTFDVVEKAILDLKTASDQVTKSFMNDSSAEKFRSTAHSTGHQALTDINKRIQGLNAKVRYETKLEEKEWVTNPALRNTYSAELRQKMDMMHAVTKKFQSYAYNFQNAQMTTKAVLEQKVKRVLRAINNDLTDAQIDLLVETDRDSAIKMALISQNSSEVDQILTDALEKHSIVKDIKRSAQEIHSMTLDLAMLAEEQSHMIERIEASVLNARSEVQDGIQNLVQAGEHLKKSKKCLCCAIVCSIIGVIILILVVGGIVGGLKAAA